MYDDGYKKQYNIDYSRNVIHYMKQRNKRLRSSMIFETMNVLDLDYEDNQFDVIFDKAVFDCVLCGIDADTKANIFMNEIYRVLKPKGYFFLVSNSNPESRLKYLQKSNLKYDIFIHSITNDKEQTKIYEENNAEMTFMKKTYYVYICQKMEEGKNKSLKESNHDNEEEDDINETNVEFRKCESSDFPKLHKDYYINDLDDMFCPIYDFFTNFSIDGYFVYLKPLTSMIKTIISISLQVLLRTYVFIYPD